MRSRPALLGVSDGIGMRAGQRARRDGSAACGRRYPARQHGDDRPGRPWRGPAGGAPGDRRAGAAPRPGGRFAGCGARRLGRRRGGAGAVDTSRTDTVANRRSTAQKADRMAAGGAAARVWDWRINGRNGGTTIAPRRVAGARPAEEGRRGMLRRGAAGCCGRRPPGGRGRAAWACPGRWRRAARRLRSSPARPPGSSRRTGGSSVASAARAPCWRRTAPTARTGGAGAHRRRRPRCECRSGRTRESV